MYKMYGFKAITEDENEVTLKDLTKEKQRISAYDLSEEEKKIIEDRRKVAQEQEAARIRAEDRRREEVRAEAKAREEGHLPVQDSLVETYLHRWRYSRVRGALEAPWLETAPGLFLAGDAFAAAEGRTDVERSVLSGRFVAEELASRLRPAIQPS
jgi:predicted NAD/FAD-dependent oxidoreductase